MLIEKILNNNVVVTKDESDREIIVMGKGLAFQKHPGDFISPKKIDKTFHLGDNDSSQQFQELVLNIPLEYLKLAVEIIEDAQDTLNISLNDSIYISLTDHLNSAIERAREGIHLSNALLWEIKRLFVNEYRIGEKAVDKIAKEYGIELSMDEAGFIALHIVNAQTDIHTTKDMYGFTKAIQDVLNVIRYYFHIEFKEESVYFYRFTTHLRFFLSRVMEHIDDPTEVDEDLFSLVKSKYKNAFHCVERIAEYLENKFDYSIQKEEMLYLTIQIARLIEKSV